MKISKQRGFILLGMPDEIDYSVKVRFDKVASEEETKKVARHLSDLTARAEQEIKQGADREAVEELFTKHARAYVYLVQELAEVSEHKAFFVRKDIETLLNNPPSVLRNEPARGRISPEILDSKYRWFANRVPQAEVLNITPAERADLIIALEEFELIDRDTAVETAVEIRDNPNCPSTQREIHALLRKKQEDRVAQDRERRAQ